MTVASVIRSRQARRAGCLSSLPGYAINRVMALRWLALLVGLLASWSCGTATAHCASTCAGCCDAFGTCQKGTAVKACGVHGSTCSACSSDGTCSDGGCYVYGVEGDDGGEHGDGGFSQASLPPLSELVTAAGRSSGGGLTLDFSVGHPTPRTTLSGGGLTLSGAAAVLK
jgi:hypothetical protein